MASDRESELNRESLNFYLRDTSRGFETLMHRLPLGSADVSMRVPSGEMIKLRLEMTENKIQFDFKGTENSSRVAITERTTLSACMWTVLSMIDEKIAINSGLFEHFQVSAPSGTMLDQKGAVGTERGVQMLVPALCNLIVTAFAKLNPALKGADCPGGFARLLIEAGQERAILTAACGSRATSKEAGEDACALFGSQQAKAAENSNLVSWIMRGLNPKSGGDGKFKGGDGELLHFKITKPSTLRWDLSAGSAKSPGASQGKPGESAQLSIIRNGQPENEIKEREGSIELASGDEVKLFGAGGGGFGEPLTTE
ncbi:MAG TPA: hydantoinase B/oxoprolinase family protein [Bdellovibrionales bacterium]|nr:hydantoinase B/oxoprolinase family protein [Bdellovibrionales bacterium]